MGSNSAAAALHLTFVSPFYGISVFLIFVCFQILVVSAHSASVQVFRIYIFCTLPSISGLTQLHVSRKRKYLSDLFNVVEKENKINSKHLAIQPYGRLQENESE